MDSGTVYPPDMPFEELEPHLEERARPIVKFLKFQGFITEESCGGHKSGDSVWVTLLPSIQSWKWTMHCLFGGGYKNDELPVGEEENWDKWVKEQSASLNVEDFNTLKQELENKIPTEWNASVEVLYDWNGYDLICLLIVPIGDVMADKTNEMDIKKWERKHDVDNRDIATTWLWIDNYESPEGFLEVNPWDLVCNIIENLGFEEEEEKRFLTKVTDLLKEIEDAANARTTKEE